MCAYTYSYVNKLKRSAEGKGVHMKAMPDGDFRLNEMITEDMVADEYDRKTSCQLRFQQTSVEVSAVRRCCAAASDDREFAPAYTSGSQPFYRPSGISPTHFVNLLVYRSKKSPFKTSNAHV